MIKYKKFLSVIFVLSCLAVSANAGQGAGTDSALESSAADRCAQTCDGEGSVARFHDSHFAIDLACRRLAGSYSDGATGDTPRPL